jgi:ubiquinone biosynthesis protein
MRARFIARAVIIAGLAFWALLRFLLGWILLALMFEPRARRQAWAGRCLASLLRQLGATFVKLGQILSTRPDLLPAPLIRELEVLQDDVGPFDFHEVRRIFWEDFDEPLENLFEDIDPDPLASASVAQVHRAVLPSGRKVAVKVRRPEVERLVELDLSAMRLFGRLLELAPSFALLAPTESIEEFGRGIRTQLDFAMEAEHNRRFRANFAGDPDVLFPELVPELCSSRVLTMELVEGHKILEYKKVAADPKRLAAIGVRVLLKMIFEDGFVHADLHPGNLFVTPGGPNGAKGDRVAILDLGLVGELGGEHKRGLATYFAAFAQGDGATMARLMTELSPSARALRDYPAFERAICEFVGRYHGRRLGEVQVSVVFLDMMDILRRHRLRANPIFTLVNIAIMVTEGIGKQLDPELDLMRSALPFFARMGVVQNTQETL